jgi:hypothetical protein
MAFWNTSTLSGMSGHMKKPKILPMRISKQHIAEHRMFGNKRSGIRLSKPFRGFGKVSMKKPKAPKMEPKQKGISPSLEEFDKMMSSMMKSGRTNGSKFSGKFWD